MKKLSVLTLAATALLLSDQRASAQDKASPLQRDLAAHWPLAGDALELKAPGRESWLEVPAERAPRLGKGDFTIALWMQSDEVSDVVPGDLLSQYDPVKRRGFHFTLKSNLGVTSNQANWRHLQFGIDDDRASAWSDCGRPGKALFAFALATHEGALYAGTCEPGKEQSGRVYRYAGGEQWIDCGAPDRANSVTAFAVHAGALYAGTGKYRVAGSALPESENTVLGGRVFRYAGKERWIDCGQLPQTEAVGGMVVFRGKLYASSLYKPAGFFRYEGGSRWTDCGTPDGKRVQALTVHDGFLYASSYDGGHVYRYDGKNWTDCGQVGDNTQTYSFTSHEGRLHVGTWRSGRVFRFEDIGKWTDMGRLGEELEVMGMVVHNGRLIAGSLPLAEVYSHEGGATWKRLARLDLTPDVKYRRAWTMAEHDGQVYCSTLPSGKVFAFSAGQQAMWGHSLSSAWHHVAAVKSASCLTLFVDGKMVAQTPAFEAAGYDLDTTAPLRIGAGANGPFNGRLSDLRIYRRTLEPAEIRQLAAKAPKR
ncbi:MAG: LamG domain-containing protein [Verrucomicrobia bacterium]|nr:LamG domain-containing protein [Verrucomicrobiota bacterium]